MSFVFGKEYLSLISDSPRIRYLAQKRHKNTSLVLLCLQDTQCFHVCTFILFRIIIFKHSHDKIDLVCAYVKDIWALNSIIKCTQISYEKHTVIFVCELK